MQPKQQHLPIGYWIKKADELLTKSINEVHKNAHLTRLGWQLLHTIYKKKTIKTSELIEMVSLFADATVVKQTLYNFSVQDLIKLEDEVKLTAKGNQLHEQCLERQKAIRQQAMQGVSEEAYMITIQTLEKIVNNLETK